MHAALSALRSVRRDSSGSTSPDQPGRGSVNSLHDGWVSYEITIVGAARIGQKREWPELVSGNLVDLEEEAGVGGGGVGKAVDAVCECSDCSQNHTEAMETVPPRLRSYTVK